MKYFKGGDYKMDCKRCEVGKMMFNEEWDKEFDRLDRTYPDYDSIKRELNRRGIPKYICSNCKFEELEKI